MQKFVELLKNSNGYQRTVLVLFLLGFISSLIKPVNLSAAALWLLVFSQNIFNMTLSQYIKELEDENYKLFLLNFNPQGLVDAGLAEMIDEDEDKLDD
jgi:hypothetical protein